MSINFGRVFPEEVEYAEETVIRALWPGIGKLALPIDLEELHHVFA